MKNMPLDRRQFLQSATASAVMAASATSRVRAEEEAGSFRVAPGVRQLFLDDLDLKRVEGFRRTVNPPRRHPENPILKPDTAWERGCQVYGTAPTPGQNSARSSGSTPSRSAWSRSAATASSRSTPGPSKGASRPEPSRYRRAGCT